MPQESIEYISDFVITNPVDSTDTVASLGGQARGIKKGVKQSFPNVSGAVTSSHTELNLLDGLTGTVWTSTNDGAGSGLDADLLDGLSSNAFAQLNAANTFSENQSARKTGATVLWEANYNDTVRNSLVASSSGQGFTGTTSNHALGIITNNTERINIAANGAITFNGISLTDLARLSQANAFTANQNITKSAARLLINDTGSQNAVVQFTDGSGTRGFVGTTSTGGAGAINAGDAAGDIALRAENGNLSFSGDGGSSTVVRVEKTGALTTPNARADEVGYKGTPRRVAAATSENFVLADAGKLVYIAASAGQTYTIPASTFPIGTVIRIYCGSSPITLANGETMYLAGTAHGVSGNRTMATGSMATVEKLDAHWMISGVGIS